MAWLYNLEPQELRTPSVEALSSYVVRLATAHSTTVGNLLTAISVRFMPESDKWLHSAVTAKVAALVRPNETTATLVRLLHKATGRPMDELASMTLLSLRLAMGRSQKTFTTHLRWCSYCLRDQMEINCLVFLKLIWQLLDVKTCELHHIDLTDACTQCGRHQDSYAKWESINTCIHCKASLSEVDRSGHLSSSWQASAPEIRRLVRFIAENAGVSFPKDGLQRAARELYGDACRQGRWKALARSLPPGIYPEITHDRIAVVTLRTAVRLSEAVGIALEDLLMGHTCDTNIALQLDQSERPNQSDGIGSKKGSLGLRTDLLVKVNAFVVRCGATNPPSLRQVARSVNASVGGLQNAFPEKCHAIVEAYKLARDERLRRAKVEAAEAASRIVLSWSETSADPLSRKALMRQVAQQGSWAKNVVRSAVLRIFETTNIQR